MKKLGKLKGKIPRLKEKNVIGTKWVFRNKLNENGEVVQEWEGYPKDSFKFLEEMVL